MSPAAQTTAMDWAPRPLRILRRSHRGLLILGPRVLRALPLHRRRPPFGVFPKKKKKRKKHFHQKMLVTFYEN
ncbi:hypothetical protein STEG23_032656 [Scotinomys teguina]